MSGFGLLVPGVEQYPEVNHCAVNSYEFAVEAYLALSRDYLEALVGLAKATLSSHIIFSDALSFDFEEIVSAVRNNRSVDAIWGLSYESKSSGGLEIIWPQAFWVEGGAELGVVGFNHLGHLDHLVSVDSLDRYLAIEENINLETYLSYLWLECFVSKIPKCMWVKEKNSPLKLSVGSLEALQLNSIERSMGALAQGLSGEHKVQINNKNLYEAIRLLKENKVKVDIVNHFSFASAFPFYGYIDFPLPNNDAITLFSNGDDIVCNSLVWTGSYEEMSTSLWVWLLVNREYSFCLDIGSYDGFFALIAAKLLKDKSVHAFEPLHNNYARCVLNRNTNQLHNMQVHPLAISDSEGFSSFNIFSNEYFLTSGGSLVEGHKGAVTKKFPVYTNSIKNALPELGTLKSGLVKIDVEGVELLALNGMKELIEKKQVDVLIEVTSGDDTEAIHQFFSSFGYYLYEIDEQSRSIKPLNKLIAAKDHYTLNKIYLRDPLQAGVLS